MFLYFVFYRSNLDFYLYNLYTRGNISERSDKIGQRVIGFEQIKIMESESNFSGDGRLQGRLQARTRRTDLRGPLN